MCKCGFTIPHTTDRTRADTPPPRHVGAPLPDRTGSAPDEDGDIFRLFADCSEGTTDGADETSARLAVPADSTGGPGVAPGAIDDTDLLLGVLMHEGEDMFAVPADCSLLVGSGSQCHVQFTAPGVEERHALIEADGGVLTVEDLGGMAGTYVNEKRVGAALIGYGDIIHIGGVRLLFTSVADACRMQKRPPEAKSNGLFSGLGRMISAVVGGDRSSPPTPVPPRPCRDVVSATAHAGPRERATGG
ncbi:MAG: FHA domain-containing protein [Planctomycetes bacterium]|nr:FHA domain-containing protein [Planctomycetota bacterium]